MIALILAGGYGTRLSSILGGMPKCLAPLGAKPLLTHLYDKLSAIPDVNKVFLSTNRRFEHLIVRWAKEQRSKEIRIVADDSRSEQEKPGALRALHDLLPALDNDHIFVLAGDNIFSDDLRGMVKLHHVVHSTVIAVQQLDDPSLIKQYSCVTVDPQDNRVLRFEEKPTGAFSSLVGTGIYIFPKSVLQRLPDYLQNGGSPDSPGHFISWLIDKEPLYAYSLEGAWFDIGTLETYVAAFQYFLKTAFPVGT